MKNRQKSFASQCSRDLRAFIDWLSVTIKFPEFSTDLNDQADYLTASFSEIFSIDESCFEFKPDGWQGYTHRLFINSPTSGRLGFIALGGKSQRNTASIQLTGTFCNQVRDWFDFSVFVQGLNGKITRVDLAHDDFKGKLINIRNVKKWYKKGLFKGKKGGVNPKPTYISDFGTKSGESFYVGSRDSGKYTRCYEKGRQLGDKSSKWCRIEVEIHNKGRLIPLDVLANPGYYLAGAYPCLSFLSEQQCLIRTVRKVTEASAERSLNWLKRQAGGTVNFLIQTVYQGDISGLMFDIKSLSIPKSLQSAYASYFSYRDEYRTPSLPS